MSILSAVCFEILGYQGWDFSERSLTQNYRENLFFQKKTRKYTVPCLYLANSVEIYANRQTEGV